MPNRETLLMPSHRDRRAATIVGLGIVLLYSLVEVVHRTPDGMLVRAVWVVVLAASAALQRESAPRLADWAARVVGLVSGVCATALVGIHGGPTGIYSGFLIGTSFCVLVLVPELPSAAFLAGLSTTVGGAVLLARDGHPALSIVEWVILSVVLNGVVGWGTLRFTRICSRELAARQARAEALLDLRASNERFEAAFSSTSLGAAILAMDGSVVAANSALHEKLGHASLVGRNYFDLLVTSDVANALTVRDVLAEGGRAPRVERRFVTATGEVMLASVHSSPVHDRAGLVEHAIVMIEDITERRLLREQLAKSERLAALGTLAAGVAHEINNPLAYMKSNLCWTRERLEEGPFERDEVLVALEETARGAERIARIVGELSAYARGRADPSTAELRPIVDDALRLASLKLETVGRVEVHVPADLPPISAIARHLSQALVNLLANAADAIEARCAREPGATRLIRVSAAARGDEVVVSVDDTGDGISEDAAAHLFEPFFTTKGPRGTGLGLAISRENLSRFGAALEAGASALGGAQFRIRVPRAGVERSRERTAA